MEERIAVLWEVMIRAAAKGTRQSIEDRSSHLYLTFEMMQQLEALTQQTPTTEDCVLTRMLRIGMEAVTLVLLRMSDGSNSRETLV